jgi:hypothetical protein
MKTGGISPKRSSKSTSSIVISECIIIIILLDRRFRMGTNILSKNGTYRGTIIGRFSYLAIFIGFLLLVNIGVFGCKGTTINPTDPSTVTPVPASAEPTPVPTPTETPVQQETPTPTSDGDAYAETPDDPTVETLEVDDSPFIITMDYTQDIDWYKIQIPEGTETLYISLTDIPEECDFDIAAYVYDTELAELENGRSAQSSNTSEHLWLSPREQLIYLKIYSYSGSGEALLTLSTRETGEGPDEGPDEGSDEGPDEGDETILQLTYEEILSTYYPLYPRGTSFGLLEHSVEAIETKQITCQTLGDTLSGELTIGNYAHIERELLESTDYIDGWALVVFNGPVSVLDELTITIRVTIFAPELDLEVEVPSEMEIDGYDYLVSETGNDVYYVAQSYGDFWANSRNDIRISSEVVGDLGDLVSDNIITQQVEVQWNWTHSDGTSCSGRTRGKQIVDFEIAERAFYNTQWMLRGGK